MKIITMLKKAYHKNRFYHYHALASKYVHVHGSAMFKKFASKALDHEKAWLECVKQLT